MELLLDCLLLKSNEYYAYIWFPRLKICFQALVLGIARLPVSAPAYVDNNRNSHNARGSTESDLHDPNDDHDDGSNPTTSSLNRNISGISSSLIGTDHILSSSCKSNVSGSIQSSGIGHESSNTFGSLITRSSLAGLLRSSLPLVNDVQLLTLAQISLLVPGPAPSNSLTNVCGPVSSGAHPIDDHQPTSPTTVLSERERLVNTLARHCTPSQPVTSNIDIGNNQNLSESASDISNTTSTSCSSVGLTSSASYKSSNPRVLAILDILRKDIEKNLVSFDFIFLIFQMFIDK